MISGHEGLVRLREGNHRFVTGARSDAVATQARRLEVAGGQEPFAIILGCSDSRVPAEIVFDQGVGDLFVIRVAGNIVASSQVGSVEFAAARYGTRLVVVLGHSQCGAVLATLEELQQPVTHQSRNFGLPLRDCWQPNSGTTRPPSCARRSGRTSARQRNTCGMDPRSSSG